MREDAEKQIATVVQKELRRLASSDVARSLQPTMATSTGRGAAADRMQFHAAAAVQLRQILVDNARARIARERGGSDSTGSAETDRVSAEEQPGLVIALDEALRKLATLDERMAQLAELHYFGGLGPDEIAAVAGWDAPSVAADLRLADAWLRREIESAGNDSK